MTFFLRNISLTALILAILVGSLSVYLSARVVYENMLNRAFSERSLTLEVLGKTALEGKTSASTTPAYTTENFNTALAYTKLSEPGVKFFRVVDAGTGTILSSADEDEVGTTLSGDLPRTERGSVLLEIVPSGDTSTVMLTYLGSENRLLWMAIDQSFFVNPAIVIGVEQAAVFAFAFGLFALIFFGVVRRFFMTPIRKLKEVLSSTEKEEHESKEKLGKESFGELLESFSTVARRVESTIEHDKVISETKSDFISTTAHQLRTPLSGINWVLGALLSNSENLTDEQKSLIERALEKTKELVGIVGELLSAAGIEQGKFGFHPEEIQLKDEIDLIIAEEKQVAEKNKVTLIFEHDEQPFPTVYVDRERIKWVIRNLIENAIRYGREGGEVTVALKRETQRLLISVKDNGIGISPEAQQHIFEKFFRSSEAKRKRNDGSGIGLFIVRNIVNHHGGRIWFESVEGVGTTFFFTIPIARPTAQQKNPVASLASAPSAASVSSAPASETNTKPEGITEAPAPAYAGAGVQTTSARKGLVVPPPAPGAAEESSKKEVISPAGGETPSAKGIKGGESSLDKGVALENT